MIQWGLPLSFFQRQCFAFWFGPQSNSSQRFWTKGLVKLDARQKETMHYPVKAASLQVISDGCGVPASVPPRAYPLIHIQICKRDIQCVIEKHFQFWTCSTSHFYAWNLNFFSNSFYLTFFSIIHYPLSEKRNCFVCLSWALNLLSYKKREHTDNGNGCS